MNDRMCIVTREKLQAEELVRFVVGPSGELVPDLKQKLPGRGCWVTAKKSIIDQAVNRNVFANALKSKVDVPDNLSTSVDMLLTKSTLGMIGMARKAGQFITGSAKVDTALRNGEAVASFHATDAAEDGIRKLNQARTFYSKMTEEAIMPSFSLFSSDEMSNVLGEGNFIHAAALAGRAGESVLKRAKALADYREIPISEKENQK